MGCDCARAIPRSILSTLNFFLLAVSLAVLLAGVLLTVVPRPTSSLASSLVTAAWLDLPPPTAAFLSSLLEQPGLLREGGRLALVLAACLLLPATLGYVGAVRESRLLLTLYLAPLLLAWGLQLLVLILLPALQAPLYRALGWAAAGSLAAYTGEAAQASLLSLGWDHLMAQLSCCGVANFTDFAASPTFQATKLKLQLVPAACCILDTSQYPQYIVPEHSQCVFVPTNYNSYFTEGCLPRLTSLAASNVSSVILAVILLLSVQLVLAILAVCLCMLQRTRTDKLVHRTVLVREQPARPMLPYRPEGGRARQYRDV